MTDTGRAVGSDDDAAAPFTTAGSASGRVGEHHRPTGDGGGSA